jgi:alpha-glucosidase
VTSFGSGRDALWWRDAVVYQIYVRSFADSDGDGVGDLDGIRSRLGYLELLGVDVLWLTPFFTSPMADHGYDVADPRDVDPVFGDLAAFDALVEAAHEHGLKIAIDLVPNHTSVEHEWFLAALASSPGSHERARYHFGDGRGPGGAIPPNNWMSVFGGMAWSRVAGPDGRPGQWYLHLFTPDQPDLNWTNPEVWADLEKTMRFWLDRGIDGVRIDAAHAMSKPDGLPDGGRGPDRRFHDAGVHEIHRMIRSVVDDYPGRVAMGEVAVSHAPDGHHRFAQYLRPDELQLGTSDGLASTPFDADALQEWIQNALAAALSMGAPPTWALGHHDISRPVSRYGGGAVGVARARAMALAVLALPGAVCVYNGDELGLADVALPDEVLQDPVWERSGYRVRGRDGFRVPLPWEGAAPGYGFTSGVPWLPMPVSYGVDTVADQLEDESSTLSLFRCALEMRRMHPAFSGDTVEWFGAPPGCLAFRRSGSTLVCALNTSRSNVPLPPGEVLLASGPLEYDELPPDTAVWLA